ncbi:uncharacterized protein METZ01_LOCUS270127, partial [marine metagenome]
MASSRGSSSRRKSPIHACYRHTHRLKFCVLKLATSLVVVLSSRFHGDLM